MNNFGALTWKVEELSKSVNFLDLTITIREDRRIVQPCRGEASFQSHQYIARTVTLPNRFTVYYLQYE
jgi:hypothetical protein